MTNDQEQEIERIEQIIKDIDRPWKHYGVRATSPTYGYIKALVNAGIGDKKQAVKEFVDRLKSIIDELHLGLNKKEALLEQIDELFTELYGVEK